MIHCGICFPILDCTHSPDDSLLAMNSWASLVLSSATFLARPDALSLVLACRGACKLFQSLIESNTHLTLSPQTSRLALLIEEISGWSCILLQRERMERIEHNVTSKSFQASTFYPFGELENGSAPTKLSTSGNQRALPPFHKHLGLDAKPFEHYREETPDGEEIGDSIWFATILCSNLLLIATKEKFGVFQMIEETEYVGSEKRCTTAFRPVPSLQGTLEPELETRIEVIQQTHAVILSYAKSTETRSIISLSLIDGTALDKTELKFSKKYTGVSYFESFGRDFLLVFCKSSTCSDVNEFFDADDELEELMRIAEANGEMGTESSGSEASERSTVLELYSLNSLNGLFSRQLKLRDFGTTHGEVILFSSGRIVSQRADGSLVIFSLARASIVVTVSMPIGGLFSPQTHSDCAILSQDGRFYSIDARSTFVADVTDTISREGASSYFEMENNLLSIYSHVQPIFPGSPISASDRRHFAGHVVYAFDRAGALSEMWRDSYTSRGYQVHDRFNRTLLATVDWDDLDGESNRSKRKYILDLCRSGECVCSIMLRDIIEDDESIGKQSLASPLLYFNNGIVVLTFRTRLGQSLTLLRFDK